MTRAIASVPVEGNRQSSYEAFVSVVTPFHNSADTLARAIEGVLGQSGARFEYILADNCSTDGSGEIARAFARTDDRIRYIHFRELVPQVPNYNRALRQISAEARFCKIVQADDYLLPGCLEAMVDVGRRNPTVGVIGAGREIGDSVDLPGGGRLAEVTSGREICRATLRGELHAFGSPTSVMYRADLVRARTDFFTKDAFFDDTDAAMELLQISNFGFVPRVLSHTTRDPQSTLGRVADFDISLLYRFVAMRRIGRAYFDAGEEYASLDRQISMAYHEAVVRSLVRRADRHKYFAFHRSVLRDTAGLRPSASHLLRAFGRLASRALFKRGARSLGISTMR